MEGINMMELTAVHSLHPEQGGTSAALEEGRRGSKYLAPLSDIPGGSTKTGLASEETPKACVESERRSLDIGATCIKREHTISPESSGGTGVPEPGATTRESFMGGQALTRQKGQRGFGERRSSSNGEGVHDREIKAKTVSSGTVLEVDGRRAADQDSNGKEEEDESAQQILIWWIQARQRECAILISLGCVVTTFINYLRNGAFGALSLAVTFIPVAVNLLLTRDMYIKWDERIRRRRLQRVLHGGDVFDDRGGVRNNAPGDGGVSGRRDGGEASASCAKCSHDVGQPNVHTRVSVSHADYESNGVKAGKGGTLEVTSARDKGRRGEQRGRSAHGLESNGSRSSSNRSSVRDVTRSTVSGEVGNDNDLWATNLDAERPGEGNISYLETPYRKSIRIIYSASESVQDLSIRQQLEDVAALLSDTDSLHFVKEDALRRSATGRDTQRYIDNVLETSVKNSSVEDNWRKLKTDMLFIRSISEGTSVKEVAEQESTAGPVNTGITIEPDEAKVGSDRIKNDLDEQLEDVAASATSTCNSRDNSMVADFQDWNVEESANFDQLNQDVIQEQQLGYVWQPKSSGIVDHIPDQSSQSVRVRDNRRRMFLGEGMTGDHLDFSVAKTISQGNTGKELDRMSVWELRDLACDTAFPVKILESVSGEGYVEPDASSSQPQEISKLPTLREEHMGAVAALVADGQFLSWEFNVFDLDDLSGGHSLWYSAMSTFCHFNLIGAFGLSANRLSKLFLCVEATYCYDPAKPNIYHTHVHAADVTLTVAHFLSVETITCTVRSTHGMALLMAAIMHDYRHPGVNNSYLVRHLDPLAVMYNDSSVLENFHASEGFKLMMDPRFDVFKGWKSENVKCFRQAYVKCILATDLALSLDYISKFQSLHNSREGSRGSFSSLSGIAGNSGGSDSIGGRVLSGGKGNGKENSILKTYARAGESIQNQTLLLQMVLKVADVAHPCKPWKIHRKWSDLVTEEFFKQRPTAPIADNYTNTSHQGDMELEQGLAVSPLCDRREENLPKSQCDFIDFIVRPCVTMFSSYCQVSTWNEHLESNFRKWKKLCEEQESVSNTSSPAGSRRRSQR